MSKCFILRRRLSAGLAVLAVTVILTLVVSLVLCPASMAQQQQQTGQQSETRQAYTYGQSQQEFDRVPLSSLARENLNYVAAPAKEIEAVLTKQPGLLVQLQDWVARDATDHGQMVEQQQMTQAGIFSRLENDPKFRAVATRLLQRYGYLEPTVNPNSQLGRQQQIQYQAEMRKLQQPTYLPQTSYGNYGQAYPYNSQGAYPGSPMQRFQQNQQMPYIPPSGSYPQSPQLQQNSPSLPSLTLANANRQGLNVGNSQSLQLGALQQSGLDGVSSLSGMSGQIGLNGSSGAVVGMGGLMATANYPSLSTLPLGGYSSRSRMNQGLGGAGQQSTGPPIGPQTRGGQYSPYYQQQGYGQNFQTQPSHPQITHRANPYSSIPSLYDLYEQVSSHSPKLQRFGLAVFENAPVDRTELPMDIPAGPNYVVGPGDGLTINLWGSISERLYRVVDREGRLNLPEVGPLMVSGETMGEVQQKVQQSLRTQFRNISADVSLSRLRTIRVYVVGEVRNPGAYDISSLSTPLNALFAAGGPTKEGSLRLVKHFRGNQLIQNVDLYDLLLHGVRSDLKRLENGDTILVPPVGPEVTVEGMVRRPAIYELRGEKTLAQVLQLAGGILPTATLRHIEVQRVVAHEKRTMLSLNIRKPEGSAQINRQLRSFDVHDGDVIRIFPIAPYNTDMVFLEGHVLRPGSYSYHPGMRLSDLISSYSDLLPQPEMSYAEIIRLNPPDYAPSVKSFNLAAALAHPKSSPKLDPLDTVRIFSRFDFHYAPTVSVGGDVRNPGTYRTSGVVRVRDAIYQAGGLEPNAYLKSARLVRSLPDGKLEIMSINLRKALNGDPRDNILLHSRDRILVRRDPLRADPASVYIEGEVERPGRFPLTSNLRVSDLVALAGGLKRSADTRTADMTIYNVHGPHPEIGKHQEINLAAALRGGRSDDPVLHDGDVLTIKEIPSWGDIGASITIRGEVRHPGVYGIAPGERLSSVLERAGGFLPTAYPEAAVLNRISVKQLQEKSRNELIQEVEQNATNVKVSINATAADQAALQSAALQQRKQVLAALRSAPVTGRLVIHLTRNLKAFAKSQDNIQVRAGDTLMIPKRPDFVIVTGQVYNSNAITYEPGRSVGWYLRRAGGVTALGNKSAVFLVRADGSVVSNSGNRWWHGDVMSVRVGPGDTVVVPEKALGGSLFWKNLIQISQVASSTAIVASLVP